MMKLVFLDPETTHASTFAASFINTEDSFTQLKPSVNAILIQETSVSRTGEGAQ